MTIKIAPYFFQPSEDAERVELDGYLDLLHDITDGKFQGLTLRFAHTGPGSFDADPMLVQNYPCVIGPTMLIQSLGAEAYAFTYSLPHSERAAAASGRLIQEVAAGDYIQVAFDELADAHPEWVTDCQTNIFLTRNCLILHKEDAQMAVEQNDPAKSGVAAMLVCTVIPRSTSSTHGKLALAERISQDVAKFYSIKKYNFQSIEADGSLEFTLPQQFDVARHL